MIATDTIAILYYAAPNAHTGGYVPLISVNGRQQGSTYCERHMTKAEALTQAHHDAEDEESHYGGDFTTTIQERV